MSETIDVRNGDTVETCDVINSYSHRGNEYAQVEGDTISGFVKVE